MDWQTEEEQQYRQIEEFPDYFINRDGDVRRKFRKGRPQLFRPDDEGNLVGHFIAPDGSRQARRIKDLVNKTFPEGA